MIIKFCGITNYKDAEVAVNLGVDMLGFNFFQPSPRYISPKNCKAILQELSNNGLVVKSVGIFVNEESVFVNQILDYCGLDLAQLSGDEGPEDLSHIGEKAIKCIRIKNDFYPLIEINDYPIRSTPPQFILDSYQPNLFGGTGQQANWKLASEIASKYNILLAGGITPDNVIDAITLVKPYGIDLASGIEYKPGQKDPLKMQKLVTAARNFGVFRGHYE